jgi:hypothetical protein
MNFVPKDELIKMGHLHLKTDERMKELLELDCSRLEVTNLQGSVHLYFRYLTKIKSSRIPKEFATTKKTFCDAMKALHNDVFGKEVEETPESNTVEDRLTKIEEALTSLANKIKE